MRDTTIPEPRVLTEAVLEAMGDDRLSAAVFLTFQLEPTFFEDAILAPLCGVDSRGSAAVRRYVLEEQLCHLDEVLVLYDPQGLTPEGPMRQRVRAVPVFWPGGVQHAKHALLLVGPPGGESLVLLTTSANLTRSGWWENVEAADVERIGAGSATSLRGDLLELVALIRRLDNTGEPHHGLDRIERFVRDRLAPAPGLPRLWLGAEPLDTFLARHVPQRATRVELVAPYVDEEAAPIARLALALAPAEIVVVFPIDRAQNGAAVAGWRDGVRAIPNARFGALGVDTRVGTSSNKIRFIHAKVIRITDVPGKRTWTLVGSPNLSNHAHAGWSSGRGSNIETAILRVAAETSRWLSVLAQGSEPAPASALVTDDDPRAEGLPVRVRYDWRDGSAALWLGCAPCAVCLGPAVSAGTARVRIPVTTRDAWVPLGADALRWLAGELVTSNVVSAWGDGGLPAPVLVEEHGMAFRPSMVASGLSPADILRHWSMLTEAQRAEHIASRLEVGHDEDPEAPAAMPVLIAEGTTMFDTFSGILHGFLMLRSRMLEAIRHHQEPAVEAWLLGARHDSVGTLLTMVVESETDPVRLIVYAMCTRDLLDLVERRLPGFVVARPLAAAALRARVAELDAAWDKVDVNAGPNEPPGAFRTWIEDWWRREAEVSV